MTGRRSLALVSGLMLVLAAPAMAALLPTHRVAASQGVPISLRSHLRLRPLRATQQQTPDPHVLQLPASAFSPAAFDTKYCNGVLSNAAADNPSYYPGTIHSTSYDGWGRLTGYCQVAAWSPDSSSPIYFSYDPSIFQSVSGAEQAWNDANSLITSHYPAQNKACSTAVSATCSLFLVSFSDGSSLFTEIQSGVCLMEANASFSTAQYSAYQSQIDQVMTNISVAFVAAARAGCGTASPTAVPTATRAPTATSTPLPSADFDILARFEAADSNFDPSKPALTHAVQGTTVHAVLYTTIRSETGDCQQTLSFQVVRGGATTLSKSAGPVPCPNTSTNYFEPVTLKHPGTYTFTARETLAGVTKQASAQIRVTAPPAPSFQLEAPVTTDANYHPQTSFHVKDHGYVLFRWIAQHLPRSGVATTLTYAYEVTNGHGGWTTKFGPVHATEKTHNGENEATPPFTAQKTSRMRFVVTLSLLGRSATQSTTVSVRP